MKKLDKRREHMKKLGMIIIAIMLAVVMAGCGAQEEPADMSLFNSGKTVGKDIAVEDITDFYYTVENINYDAYYQRYRFYIEDGKHIFFHETRERPDDYGPCTEEDTTLTGTMELTDEQWAQFTDLVSGGTVKARSDSAESGDTGPWLYLYWTGDNGKIQQFSFESYGKKAEFEEYCATLAAGGSEGTSATQSTPDNADAGADAASIPDVYQGIDVASPDWVGQLSAAGDTDRMLIVAAFSEDANDAWVSLHEKQSDGSWHMVMTTPGFLGRKGIGKTREGDSLTPVGVYRFNRAFGIAPDPGCAIPYVQVDQDTYWSGDPREGYHYNELVSLKDVPGLDVESGDSEHIIDYVYQYQYCLNISYNEEGTPGLGSAIFLHCFGPARPFTGGCISIPEDYMRYVMTRVDENTAVVIDTYENLSGGEEWPDSTWPGVR